MDRFPLRSTSIARRLAVLLFLALSLFPAQRGLASHVEARRTPKVTPTPASERPVEGKRTPTPVSAVTAAQVIEAVNALRLDQGLPALAVNSVLMQVAQIEADGIAGGQPGHWRPANLSLGQWLISLGYPLSGDLSQDGYRSENWLFASSAEEAVQAWQGDAEHTNTMLSEYRSDIGAGVVIGDEATVIVLVTALQTASGKMQGAASPLLTQAASGSAAADGSLAPQYIKEVVLSTAHPNGDVVHKIQYGQTLWSIAIAYHTSIDQLRAWNNLAEGDSIYEGQFLLVERNATQPAPETPTAPTSSAPPGTAAGPHPAASPTAAPPPAVETPAESTSSTGVPSWLLPGLGVALIVLGGLVTLWGKHKQ